MPTPTLLQTIVNKDSVNPLKVKSLEDTVAKVKTDVLDKIDRALKFAKASKKGDANTLIGEANIAMRTMWFDEI